MSPTQTSCKDCKFGIVKKMGPNDSAYTKCAVTKKKAVFVKEGRTICDSFESRDKK